MTESGIEYRLRINTPLISKMEFTFSKDYYVSLFYNSNCILIFLFFSLLISRYRRFVCASNGDVNDQDLHLSNVKLIDDKGLQAAATRAAQMIINPKVFSPPKIFNIKIICIVVIVQL